VCHARARSCDADVTTRIEPAPYASQTVLNKAVPCLSAIRLASSCGADVSIVNVLEKFDFTRSSLPCDPNINAPLGGQKSPCRCLCAIVGAWSPNRRVCGYQPKHFRRRLSANTLLIDRLLKAGFGSKSRERPGLGIFLAPAIQSGAFANALDSLFV
jgi:hypothetical protein